MVRRCNDGLAFLGRQSPKTEASNDERVQRLRGREAAGTIPRKTTKMLHLQDNDFKVFEVALYNEAVRTLVNEHQRHMYFDDRSGLSALFATHPPLEKRIAAIEGREYIPEEWNIPQK